MIHRLAPDRRSARPGGPYSQMPGSTSCQRCLAVFSVRAARQGRRLDALAPGSGEKCRLAAHRFPRTASVRDDGRHPVLEQQLLLLQVLQRYVIEREGPHVGLMDLVFQTLVLLVQTLELLIAGEEKSCTISSSDSNISPPFTVLSRLPAPTLRNHDLPPSAVLKPSPAPVVSAKRFHLFNRSPERRRSQGGYDAAPVNAEPGVSWETVAGPTLVQKRNPPDAGFFWRGGGRVLSRLQDIASQRKGAVLQGLDPRALRLPTPFLKRVQEAFLSRRAFLPQLLQLLLEPIDHL